MIPIRSLIYLCALSLSLPQWAAGQIINGPIDNSQEYIIAAEYYPWYYPARWNYIECATGLLRTNLIPSQPPVAGFYSSADHAVIDKHLEWCSEYGVNTLIMEFIQPNDFIDTVLKKHILPSQRMKDVAFSFLYDWAIVFGSFDVTDARITKAVSDFNYLADNYFANARFLKIKGGRPVVFIYVTRALTPPSQVQKLAAAIRSAMTAKGYNIFLVGDEFFFISTAQPAKFQYWDAIFGYDVYASRGGYSDSTGYLTNLTNAHRSFRTAALSTNIIGTTTKVGFIPSVAPGFNDRAIRRTCENHPALPRRINKNAAEGSLFDLAFKNTAFETLDTSLNMIHITSFNEWHEDTQIEPTIVTAPTVIDNSPSGRQYTQGTLHEGYGMKYLEIIKNKTIAFAGKAPVQSLPSILPVLSVYDSISGAKVFEKQTFTSGKYVISRKNIIAGRTYKIQASCQNYGTKYVWMKANADSTINNIDFELLPINVNDENVTPHTFKLEQNYPNPFNPITTISYQIKYGGLVSLKIYDPIGREVQTLVNSHQESGSYNVTFDASKLNSGVYYYTLRAGEFVSTKKMIIVK